MTTLLTRQTEDVLVAYFPDYRIADTSRIVDLGQELAELANNNQKIVLNFEKVSFMSSAMIGKLVSFREKCNSADVSMRMCGINENIEEVFKLLKLGKIFSLDSDEETAVRKLYEPNQ